MGDRAKYDTGDKSENSTGAVNAYQAFFEEAAEGMFITDRNRRILAVNRQWLTMTGNSPEDLLGLDYTTMIEPQDVTRQLPLTVILQQDRVTTREQCFLCKDGSRLQGEISQRPLADGNLLSVVRDITEQKKIQAATKERTMELAALHAALLGCHPLCPLTKSAKRLLMEC